MQSFCTLSFWFQILLSLLSNLIFHELSHWWNDYLQSLTKKSQLSLFVVLTKWFFDEMAFFSIDPWPSPICKASKTSKRSFKVKINQLQLNESHQGLNISHQSSIIWISPVKSVEKILESCNRPRFPRRWNFQDWAHRNWKSSLLA